MTRKSIFPEFNLNLPKMEWPKLDLAEMMAASKLAPVEPEKVIEAHRKNMEAWTKAQSVLTEGFQAVTERQADAIRTSMEEAGSLMKTLMETKSMDGKMQAVAMKGAIEAQMAHMRDMGELMSKAQAEAMAILRDRLMEGIEEAQGKSTPKAKAPAPAPAAPAAKAAPVAKSAPAKKPGAKK